MKHTLPGILIVAALIAAVFPAASAHAAWRDRVERSFTVGRGGTLYLTTDLGSVTITTAPRSTVDIVVIRKIKSNNDNTIESELDRLDMDMEQNGDDVSIRTKYTSSKSGWFPWFGNNKLQLTYEITVPETYNVVLKTSGGSIHVDDLTGEAVCHTSGGSISLARIGGSVDARTSGGSITLNASSGDAVLKTSGGSITAGDVEGTIDANTSGGSIRMHRVYGSVTAHTSGGGITINDVDGAVDASTSGGSVTASISGQPGGDCRLTTSGGGISVGIDPSHRYSIDAKTSGGGVSTDIPVTVTGSLKRSHLVADVNGGGPKLYLRTSGGGIKISKR